MSTLAQQAVDQAAHAGLGALLGLVLVASGGAWWGAPAIAGLAGFLREAEDVFQELRDGERIGRVWDAVLDVAFWGLGGLAAGLIGRVAL